MTLDHEGVGAEDIDWDVHYSAAEQVWSGNPNGVPVAEISDATPGTEVDVGCGGGADAIWLAHRKGVSLHSTSQLRTCSWRQPLDDVGNG